MSARLLMIALDGADGGHLDRASLDGSLPNLAALRGKGAARRLTSPEGISDDALWASFEFGSDLGEHGRYHWQQRLASGELGMAYRDESDREPFWGAISRGGGRVAVIDVPKCGPPRPINGIHLVDWLVHGRYFNEPRSFPGPLAAEVVRRFGGPPPSLCAYELDSLTDDQVREVTLNLRTSVSQKRAAALHYLASEPWDAFIVGFKEAHCAGHHLWHLVDERHPEHDGARAERLGRPFRTILGDLDAAVGDLVSAAGPNAVVIVFSTTDMEPASNLSHLMPTVAERIDRRLGSAGIGHLARRILGRLAGRPTRPLCEVLPYNENCTALRLNPRGAVPDSGRGRRAALHELGGEVESMLRELVDLDTGEPLIAAIDRPSEEQAGLRAHALPDLLIRYRPGTIPSAIASPRLGRVEAAKPTPRPGDHAAGGLLIASGAAVDSVASMADLATMASEVLS